MSASSETETEGFTVEERLRERLIAYERTIAGRGGLTKDKIKAARRTDLIRRILGLFATTTEA